MLDIQGLNYLALIAAWLVNVIVGAFWYSPAGFGKLWSKLSGVDLLKMPKDEANTAIVYVALSALVQAAALDIILHSLHATQLMNGLAIGLLLWLGFTAATTIGTTFYARKGWNYWWLNSSYFLLVMAVNSLLLTLWR